MSAMQLYSNAYVYINGKLLTQESSVSVNKKSGLNLVYTTVIGLGGATKGSAEVEINIDNAIPSADFELNPDDFMITGEVVEVTIAMCDGSRTSTHSCFMMEADYSHSVNDASKLAFKLSGRFAPFEGAITGL